MEGFKLFPIKNLTLEGLKEEEIIIVMLAVMVSFLIAGFIKVPLSLSKGIVGAILGYALAKGYKINLSYAFNILLFWFLLPLLAFFLSIFFLKLDRKLSYGRVWIKVSTLKPLLIISSFLIGYTIGSNTLSILLALSDSLYTILIGSFIGSFFFSGRILRFIGEEIFGLRYVSSFSSQTLSAILVELATQIHIPVAVSEIVTSSMMGTVFSYKVRILNIKKIFKIFLGWFLLPIIPFLLSLLIGSFKLGV